VRGLKGERGFGNIAELRVATKADIGELRRDIGDLKSGLAAVKSRLDRIFLTLAAGYS
jgi:hypothetical protein